MTRLIILVSVVISGCSNAGQHGVVTVFVIDDRQSAPTPLTGSMVVFVDSERAQIVATDANGRAQAEVGPDAN
jgi:hypothetical protein